MLKGCILFLVLFWEVGYACIVEGHPKYLKTEKWGELSRSEIVKYSNCQDDVKRRFTELLTNSFGKVPHYHLKKIVKSGENIKIKPEKIEFFDLEETLKNQYPLKKNWVFKNTYFTGRQQLYPYGEDEEVKIVCRNCQKPGEKILEIIFYNPLNGKRRVVWGKTYIAVRMRSLVATQTLGAGSLLNPMIFKEQFSYSINSNENFFVNKEKLFFYKTNKAIREGMTLKRSDVSAINLVNAGKTVKTIIRKNDMNLTGVGVPIGNGKLGDSIHVKGMDGKKIIVGKVIGFDTVEVSL